MGRQISTGRKALYYVGMALIILGCVSFASTFVTFAMHFGEFHNFEPNARSIMFRAFGGMAVMVVGAAILNVDAHGAAGSGVVLDPRAGEERP